MLDNEIFQSQTLTYKKLFNTKLSPHFCHQLNMSQCFTTENALKITVYNPLSNYLSFPVSEQGFQ